VPLRVLRGEVFLLIPRLFEVRVPVQPVLVEPEQAAGFLEVDAAFADGGLD
jgi:hypothetical protein